MAGLFCCDKIQAFRCLPNLGIETRKDATRKFIGPKPRFIGQTHLLSKLTCRNG